MNPGIKGPLFLRSALVVLMLMSGTVAVAQSFVAKVVNLKGVTIRSARSSTGCGADLVISVSDGDRHFVMIDYSYAGLFPYIPGRMEKLVQDTREGVINVNVGPLTYGGNLTRVPADALGLVCSGSWDFDFRPAELNSSQGQRNHEQELRDQEQAKKDSQQRILDQQAENKRRAEQISRDFYAARDREKLDRINAYRSAAPENARCIINSQADINACEQWKAGEREAQLRRDAQAQQERDRIDRAQALERQQAAAQREYDRSSALAKSNPCAAAAIQRERPPETQPYPAGATADAKAWIDKMNAARIGQWKQAQAAREATCASAGSAPTASSQPQLQQQQEALRLLMDLIRGMK